MSHATRSILTLVTLAFAGCAPQDEPGQVEIRLVADEPATVRINGAAKGEAPVTFTLAEVPEFFQRDLEAPTSSIEKLEEASAGARGAWAGGGGFRSTTCRDGDVRFAVLDVDQGPAVFLLRHEHLTVFGGFRVEATAGDGTRLAVADADIADDGDTLRLTVKFERR